MNDPFIRAGTPMNLIGWILVAVGVAGLLTSVAGILCLFFQPTPAEVLASSESDLYLHDTYYVVSRPIYAIWPLVLCLVLSVAISITVYMHTEHFVRSMMPAKSSPDSQPPPNDEGQ